MTTLVTALEAVAKGDRTASRLSVEAMGAAVEFLRDEVRPSELTTSEDATDDAAGAL